MRHREIVAERMRAHRGCEKLSVDSRQRRRALVRQGMTQKVDELYGPRPYSNSQPEIKRAARRDIARIWAKKESKI